MGSVPFGHLAVFPFVFARYSSTHSLWVPKIQIHVMPSFQMYISKSYLCLKGWVLVYCIYFKQESNFVLEENWMVLKSHSSSIFKPAIVQSIFANRQHDLIVRIFMLTVSNSHHKWTHGSNSQNIFLTTPLCLSY